MNDDDIDPQLIWEVDDALNHGLADIVVELCQGQPPHIHLAEVEGELPGAPLGTHPVGVIVVGTVPDLSDDERAAGRAAFDNPALELISVDVEMARMWKEETVNESNGPADLSPLMRVSWPTFASVFDLGDFCTQLSLPHPATAMNLIHEAMVRPFGVPIGVELILDTWAYFPPDGESYNRQRLSPGEAFRRRLPGAYEAMLVTVASPFGSTSRYCPYRYGGGNVEWIKGLFDPDTEEWHDWGKPTPGGATSEGHFEDALRLMFGPPRVRGKTSKNQRKEPGNGTTQ
jgi:hypothetical protein